MSTDSARLQTIEGQTTLVVDRTPPLPRKLDALIATLFSVVISNDIRPAGAASQCEQWRTHRFGVLRQGKYLGPDRVFRDLRLDMCADCGAVCVHDISLDSLDRLKVGRNGPARRDLILGWYSGSRRNARHYG
jgi:hypothetical protein